MGMGQSRRSFKYLKWVLTEIHVFFIICHKINFKNLLIEINCLYNNDLQLLLNKL